MAAADVFASLHALGSAHGISFDTGRLRLLPHEVSKATDSARPSGVSARPSTRASC